ncbi:hypothetical protein VP01_2137g3 [Puccinia sorghi]|uniref:Uncharacterized protein n=1 Tax=Puccinia sorghi TaxID=27349 RepID=A0A0L6VBM8_9BASI|nr:hypothetical protein VP01_2137g3 [Puccinia sorghi]
MAMRLAEMPSPIRMLQCLIEKIEQFGSNSKTKHLDIKMKWLQDLRNKNEIQVTPIYCRKSLNRLREKKFLGSLFTKLRGVLKLFDTICEAHLKFLILLVYSSCPSPTLFNSFHSNLYVLSPSTGLHTLVRNKPQNILLPLFFFFLISFFDDQLMLLLSVSPSRFSNHPGYAFFSYYFFLFPSSSLLISCFVQPMTFISETKTRLEEKTRRIFTINKIKDQSRVDTSQGADKGLFREMERISQRESFDRLSRVKMIESEMIELIDRDETERKEKFRLSQECYSVDFQHVLNPTTFRPHYFRLGLRWCIQICRPHCIRKTPSIFSLKPGKYNPPCQIRTLIMTPTIGAHTCWPPLTRWPSSRHRLLPAKAPSSHLPNLPSPSGSPALFDKNFPITLSAPLPWPSPHLLELQKETAPALQSTNETVKARNELIKFVGLQDNGLIFAPEGFGFSPPVWNYSKGSRAWRGNRQLHY